MELKPEVKELAEIIFKTKYPYTTNSVLDQDSISISQAIIEAGYNYALSQPSEMKVIGDIVKILDELAAERSIATTRIGMDEAKRLLEAQLTANQQVEARLKARIKELEETYKAESDDLWSLINSIKKEIDSRRWITEGRGSYEFDDEKYREESGYAFDAIMKILDGIKKQAEPRYRNFEALQER